MQDGRLLGRQGEGKLVAAVRRVEHEPAADLLEAPVLVCDGEAVLSRKGRSDTGAVHPLGESERSGGRVREREMREEEVARGEGGSAGSLRCVLDSRAEERELVAESFSRRRLELACDVPPFHARVVVRAVVAGERDLLLRIKRKKPLRDIDARVGSKNFFEGEEGRRPGEDERPGSDHSKNLHLPHSSFNAAATSVAAASPAGREAATS